MSPFFVNLPTSKARMQFFPGRWQLRFRLRRVWKHQRGKKPKPKPPFKKKKKKTFYIAIKGKWEPLTALTPEMPHPSQQLCNMNKNPSLLPIISWPVDLHRKSGKTCKTLHARSSKFCLTTLTAYRCIDSNRNKM